jgi:hypothetical protein
VAEDPSSKQPGCGAMSSPYSVEQLSMQKNEFAKWERDVERKALVIKEVGALTGWDGATLSDEYDIVGKIGKH